MADVQAQPTPTEAPAQEKDVAAQQSEAGVENTPAAESETLKETSERLPMMKTTAKMDRNVHKNNVKFDASKAPKENSPAAIRRQVEFYFSDSNLPVDKFMWKITGGKENKPVPLSTITTFGRMRRFQPYEEVVAALKNSTLLVVEGDTGKETIKRKKAYDSEKRDNVNAKSVYVKGFGDEKPATQFELEAFFTKYGPVNSVRLRRTNEKLFKGSVFVEFEDEETQKKFLSLDPKPTWEGHDLLIMSKVEYVETKCEQIRNGEIEPSSKPVFFEGKDKYKHKESAQKNGRGGRGSGKHRGGRGGRGGRGRPGGGRGGNRNGVGRTPAVDVAAVDVAAAEVAAAEASSKVNSEEKPVDAQSETPVVKRELDDGAAADEPSAKKVKVENVDAPEVENKGVEKGTKRAREEETAVDEPSAKKVDVKTEE